MGWAACCGVAFGQDLDHSAWSAILRQYVTPQSAQPIDFENTPLALKERAGSVTLQRQAVVWSSGLGLRRRCSRQSTLTPNPVPRQCRTYSMIY